MHCVLCNLPVTATEGIGLIGNGGIVCRGCLRKDPVTARELSSRNPESEVPAGIFEARAETATEHF